MKTLIVMVGTSAIENDDIGRGPNFVDNKNLIAQVKSYKNSRYTQVESNLELFDQLVDAHKLFWTAPAAHKANPRWFRQTSAELISTHYLAQKTRPERVFLLGSGTNEGWMAAKINASIMRDVWCWEKVHASRANGLDATMLDVTKRLKTCIDEEWNLSNETDVTINFTGGFKGTVAELTLLAASRSWKMCYQHEKSGEAVLIPLTPTGPGKVEPIWMPNLS